MAESLVNEVKVAALPKEGVHCFAANNKQITTRRIVTVILTVVFAVLTILSFTKKSIPLGVVGICAAVVCILVFIQTFLIAKYRVAIDYNEKNIVLRYRFGLIKIPFEAFDARDGEPDKAEALLDSTSNGAKVYYLVLDNVYDEACFQTSTKDLATREDFFKLKEEAFAIAEAYGARNSEDAIKPNQVKGNASDKLKTDLGDGDIDDIVSSAFDEVDAEKEEAEKK